MPKIHRPLEKKKTAALACGVEAVRHLKKKKEEEEEVRERERERERGERERRESTQRRESEGGRNEPANPTLLFLVFLPFLGGGGQY